MPYQGTYTQQAYAQQMIDEYKAAGIRPAHVFPQSFNRDDVLYWLSREAAFGAQAVYLDGRVDVPGGYAAAEAGMNELARQGVRIIPPPMWTLLTLDSRQRVVPSDYALAARRAGLDIITWTPARIAFVLPSVSRGSHTSCRRPHPRRRTESLRG
jgi:glycerophosphoryl diester phosphodiesterase